MSKKYAIEKAFLNCKYGKTPCELKPWSDRHIYVGDQLLGNESDIGEECFNGSFDTCRSPYALLFSLEVREQIFSLQQLAAYGGLPCQIDVKLSWQNSKKGVHIGKEGFNALMENGWTICQMGLGIISLTSSGQADENPVITMQERLEQLENAVDAYMKENGIKDKYKAGLMESVLLWNGYNLEDTPWDYESSKRNRDFCSFLEKENPNLFNYFERGLYIRDGKGEPIDLSYLLGINKALNGKYDQWDCVTQTIAEDRGMYNAYLEACRQPGGKEAYELLADILSQYSNPDYDGSDRYSDYANVPDQSARDRYRRDNYNSSENMSDTEVNLAILNNMITGRIEGKMPTDKTDWSEMIQDQQEQAEEISQSFLKALEDDLKGGR